jgi:D-sedoheptulose 7-phosphate isomerase
MDSSSLVAEQYHQLQRVVEAAKSDLPVVAKMADHVVQALKAGNKILTAGNGGSAADAMHMSEELVGRYRSNRSSLPSVALTADGTLLTCIGNDFGFEHIFSRQIESLGQKGDVLVLFSTSGNSNNLIEAANMAKKRGVSIIALLGKTGGKLAGKADLQWIVPSDNTARIQELHAWVMHVILEAVELAFPAK